VGQEPLIDWNYSGTPDPMAGTGATAIEQLTLWIVGLAGAALTFTLYGAGYIGWSWWEAALAALVAFDLMGGAAAAALNSSKRFYFSPPKPGERGALRLLKTGYYLPAIHVHPMLVYLLYKPEEFWIGIAIYFVVGAAAILVRQAPLYLARPLAVVCVIAAIVANAYLIRPVTGFEWLLPVLVIKLVLGYAVREEPYRPR